MIRSAPRRAIALTALVLGLSGCTALAPEPYAELAEEQGDIDKLPAELQSHAVDAASVRFAGEHGGISFYLAKSTDPMMHGNGVCILIHTSDPADAGGGSACGWNEVTSQWPFGTARYAGPSKIPDSAVTDGWLRISDNLTFRPKV